MSPYINFLGRDLGPDWIEIGDDEIKLPINRIIIILSSGDIKKSLRDALGSRQIIQ